MDAMPLHFFFACDIPGTKAYHIALFQSCMFLKGKSIIC